MGEYIVYLRVSTMKQSVEGQKLEIQKQFPSIKKIFEENVSGKNLEDRPALKEALDYLREGDTLVVYSYSRLSRSLADLLKIINLLKQKNVTLISLTEKFDSNSPQGLLFITVLGSLAQFEREILLERQRAGIEAAKLQGKYKGRQPIPLPENFDYYARKYINSTKMYPYTFSQLCRDTNLKKSTACKFINEIKEKEKTKS